MASFVEQATLTVKDDSSANLKNINRALKALFKTARSLKDATANIQIKTKGLAQSTAMIKNLTRDVRDLKAATRAVSMTVNTQGIAAAHRQLNQLRQSARTPIAVGTRAAAGGAGAGARRSPIPIHPVAAGLLGGVGIDAASIHALAAAIGRAVKEGYTQTDMADTNLALRQLPEDQKKAVNDAVKGLQEEGRKSPTGAYFNRAQQQQLLAEAIGTTGGDVAGAKFLVQQAESLAKVGQAMGQSFEQARTGAIDFIKAGEQMGQLSDSAGKFDPVKAAKFFDTMRKATMQVGQEFTGQRFRTTVGSAGVSKYGLDERGILTLALAMEEQGSKAGTGLNEAIKNLSTTRLDKKKIANLERMGLVTTEQVKTGTLAGKSVTEIFGKGAKNETELRKNILGWVMSEAIPTMQKQGVDINDPTQVQKWAGKVTSGKGTDFLAGVIIRAQEFMRDIKQAEARKADIATTDTILTESGIVAGQGVKNQLQSVLGEVANKAESVVLPVMKTMSDQMSKVSEQVREGNVDPMTAIKGMLASAGGITAVGVAAGLRGMTDEKTAPLASAGLALNVSAGLLDSAAAALIAAAALQKGLPLPGGAPTPGAPGGPGGKPIEVKPVPGTKMPDARWDRMGAPQRGIGRAAGAAAAVYLLWEAIKAYQEKTPEQKSAAQAEADHLRLEMRNFANEMLGRPPEVDNPELNKNMAALAVAVKQRKDVDERAALRERSLPAGQITPAMTARDEAQRAALDRTIAELRTAIARSPAQQGPPEPPNWLEGAIQQIKKATLPPDWKPLPAQKPEIQWPEPTAISGASEVLKAAMDNGGMQIQGAANTLSATTSTFSSVFQTGAQAIGSGGQIAASTLQGAAPGIGASIGQAAAAAIQAAVSTLSINVSANVTGGTADKGSQKAAPGGG